MIRTLRYCTVCLLAVLMASTQAGIGMAHAQTGGAPPTYTRVWVPLIALNNGSVGCGDAVVFVERPVAPTQAPLTAALRELLSLDEGQPPGQSGLYNPLYRATLQIQRVAVQDGTATINLSGTLNLGGVCDDPRVIAQLQQVALQFSTVQSVQVFVNGQPLEQLLSGKGIEPAGGNLIQPTALPPECAASGT